MSNKLAGSHLARAMLDRGDEQIWCAVSNDSDEHAMCITEHADYEFLTHIVSFDDGFSCTEGVKWQYAVPVKKVQLTQDEVGL